MSTENTEVKEVSVIESTLQQANITDAVIAKLKQDYSSLIINGLEDKEGFKKVEDARKECKKWRTLASRLCKEGREKAIREQREWIEKEKEVTGKIAEVEDYLEAQSEKIKEEEKRIIFEAMQAKKLPVRKERLLSLGVEIEDAELLKIDDSQFEALYNEFHQKMLAEKEAALKAEQARIEAERLEREKIEQARLAEEKRLKELAEATERARIESENKAKAEIEEKERQLKEQALEAERAKARAEELAKITAERAEREKQEAIQRAEKEKAEELAKAEQKRIAEVEALKKEQAEKEAREEAEKQAAIEAELSKGDIEKFADLITSLTALKSKYQFKSKKFQKKYEDVQILITKIIDHSTK